jgi:NADPH2:quinone reductase
VVDPIGGQLRETAFDHLAPYGRHLVLGDANGDDRAIPGDATWLGTRTVSGLNLGATAHLRPERMTDALAAVVDLVRTGVLAGRGPQVAPLEDAALVHHAMQDRTAPPKTVLRIG